MKSPPLTSQYYAPNVTVIRFDLLETVDKAVEIIFE